MKKILTSIFAFTPLGLKSMQSTIDWINNVHIKKVKENEHPPSKMWAAVSVDGGHLKIVMVFDSVEEFNKYDTGARGTFRAEFFEEMIKKNLLQPLIVFEENPKADPGMEMYRGEVRTYNEYFRETTKGLTEEQLKNLRGILDRGDYDKLSIWTGKLDGMALALGLTKKQVSQIDQESKEAVAV